MGSGAGPGPSRSMRQGSMAPMNPPFFTTPSTSTRSPGASGGGLTPPKKSLTPVSSMRNVTPSAS